MASPLCVYFISFMQRTHRIVVYKRAPELIIYTNVSS